MLNIHELCIRSHQISKEKGWLDNPRPFHTLTILMQSELAEALEEYRSNRTLKEIYYECVLKEHSSYGKIFSKEDLKDLLKPDFGWKPGDFKPCGIPIEIADYVIRVAQWAGTHNEPLAAAIEHQNPKWTIGFLADFEVVLARLNRYTCLAELAASEEEEQNDGLENEDVLGLPVYYLSLALHLCWQWADTNGVDLDAAIKEKEDFNRSRPMKHGGKKI